MSWRFAIDMTGRAGVGLDEIADVVFEATGQYATLLYGRRVVFVDRGTFDRLVAETPTTKALPSGERILLVHSANGVTAEVRGVMPREIIR